MKKYTVEQIKPKKYSDEKPPIKEAIWAHSKTRNYWLSAMYFDNKASWDSIIDWFIDIPGAPPEVKPLACLEHMPSERGAYIAHDKKQDKWLELTYSAGDWKSYGAFGYTVYRTIDWYIPIRLDKENEMEKETVIWEIDKCVFKERESLIRLYPALPFLKDDSPYLITLTQDELTAFARHWLDLQGYDVVKREPEIKPCPNCGYEQAEYREDYGGCWICLNSFCRLAGPHDDKDGKKWNALPRKEE